MSYVKSVLRRIWNDKNIDGSYIVKEVSSASFLTAYVISREECLKLYRKQDISGDTFEAVACKHVNQSANTVFSLFRTNDETQALTFFCSLKDVLMPLLKCKSDLLNSEHLLQKVCNFVRENPSWSAAHVAASSGWSDCFKHDEFKQQSGTVCPVTRVTPLHLAIVGNWSSVIKELLKLGVDVSAKENNGNNALHCAAGSSKDIVQILCSSATIDAINDRNNSGYTPLHLACLADKPECVKELLQSGADVNITGNGDRLPLQCALQSSNQRCVKEILTMYPKLLQTRDLKNGGTPLHWAETSQCIEELIEWGCLVDAQNFHGDTALHVMVQRGRLQCVLTLLSHNANANIANSDGDTPLHLAATSGSQDMVQMLVVFGADINWLNGDGYSARHLVATTQNAQNEHILYTLHAVGAERCWEPRENCNHGCSHDGDYNGITPATSQCNISDICSDILGSNAFSSTFNTRGNSVDEPSGSKRLRKCGGGRLLCLDGGGMRGLIMIQTLAVLETVLEAPVNLFFDWVAGTSTGAILALALAMGRSLNECRSLYFRMKDKVFVGMRPYPSAPLEEVLQKEFGKQTMMTDIKDTKVMVTSLLADRKPPQLHFFRNYDSPQKIISRDQDDFHVPSTQEPEDELVWKVIRASTAAPTYFEPLNQFLDGGLTANNPTEEALTEIQQYNSALKATGQEELCEPLHIVVSVGSGSFPTVPADCVNISHSRNILDMVKTALKIPAVVQLFVNKATETDGRVVERAQAWCNAIGASYFRLNVPLSKAISLNETDSSTLIRALWETMAYMNSHRNELYKLKLKLQSCEA